MGGDGLPTLNSRRAASGANSAGRASSAFGKPSSSRRSSSARTNRSIASIRRPVRCTEDNVLPPATQREMAARLGVDPVEIASDHAVFAIRPHDLAALLVG